MRNLTMVVFTTYAKTCYFFTGLQNYANDKKYHDRRPS